jgi:hypothetical protein
MMRGLSLQTAKNKLTLEVLEVCLKLVDFGAYGDADEIRSLVVPLLSVLNGVSDLTHEHEVVDVSVTALWCWGFMFCSLASDCVT